MSVLPTILILAYRRPELLNQVLKHLTDNRVANNIVISIDGLSFGANSVEDGWRKSVIKTSEEWAKQFSQVSIRVWASNEGITAHMQRILPELFERNSRIVVLEDDILISQEGLIFLDNCVNNDRLPQIAAAHTLSNHLNPTSEIRSTILPNQWGLCFNAKVYEEFARFLSGKRVNRKRIYESFFKNYYGQTSKIVAAENWVLHFENVIFHPNYTDAIFACAALHLGITYSVPWKSLIKDIAAEDRVNRGITTRQKPNISTHLYEPLSSGHLNYCHQCDRENNRITGLGIRQIVGGYSYRFKRIIQSDSK
jgi:hypothetical protein